jgi:hypothetical protein
VINGVPLLTSVSHCVWENLDFITALFGEINVTCLSANLWLACGIGGLAYLSCQLVSREAQASVRVQQILASTHTLTDVVDRAVIDVGAHTDFVAVAIALVCLLVTRIACAMIVLVCLTCWILMIHARTKFTAVMHKALVDVEEGCRLTVLTTGHACTRERLLQRPVWIISNVCREARV